MSLQVCGAAQVVGSHRLDDLPGCEVGFGGYNNLDGFRSEFLGPNVASCKAQNHKR